VTDNATLALSKHLRGLLFAVGACILQRSFHYGDRLANRLCLTSVTGKGSTSLIAND